MRLLIQQIALACLPTQTGHELGVYATSKLKRQQETINVLPRLASSCLMDASGWFWV